MSMDENSTQNSTPNGQGETPSSPQFPATTTKSEKRKVVQINAPSKIGSVDLMGTMASAPTSESSSLSKSAEKIPVPKFREPQDRRKAALKRLRVKVEDLDRAPQITSLLKTADGGLKAVLKAMRFSVQNETLRQFLTVYDSIPVGDRERLPWEAIVLSAELEFDTFYGAASLAVANFSANQSKLILTSSHPKIAKARIKFGLLPSGEKDRTAIDTMVGALPSPKGLTVIGKAFIGGAPDSGQEIDGKADVEDGVFDINDDLDKVFPSVKAMQDRLVPIRQRMLEDGS